MSGSLTIGGMSAGLLTGQKIIGPLTMTSGAPVGEILDINLKTGDNTIPVPEGATAVLVALPVTNAVAVKLRTNLNPGDTGLPLGLTGYAVFAIAPGVTSLILNAAAASNAFELSFI
jgi:hypothetical protein